MIDLTAVESLDKAIGTALAGLRENPQGELKEGYRWLVYHALGPRWEAPWQTDQRHGDYSSEPDPFQGKTLPASTSIGHRRRFHLGTQALKKVLPFWETEYPEMAGPRLAVQTAKKLMRREAVTDEGWEMRSRVWGGSRKGRAPPLYSGTGLWL